MVKKVIFLIFLFVVSCKKRESIAPPIAKTVIAVDEYHGKLVEDPYRNLENIKDSTVIKWLKGQGNYADRILQKIPARQRLIKQLQGYDIKKEVSIYKAKTTPNGKYFYTKTQGDEKIAKLYYKPSLESDDILLYDPSLNVESNDSYINFIKPDWEGNKVVISLAKKGEEVSDLIIMDVTTKKVLPGVIKKCLSKIGGVDWLSDNSGFIYLYSPITDPTNKDYWTNTKSILYKIGSNPKKLQDVFSMKNNPNLNLQPEDFAIVNNYRSGDGYLFALVAGSSSFFDVYYKKETDILSKKNPWRLLYKQKDKVKKFVVDNDDNIIFLSAKNSPNFQICKTSIINPDFENPEILVSEKKDRLITRFEVTKDGLFYTTKKNGIEAKLYYLNNTNEIEIQLPIDAGGIYIGSNGPDFELLRIIINGYLSPSINYLYDVTTGTFNKESIVPPIDYPDFENLIVEHIEVTSHDGIMVPVSIIRQKNIKKNGKNPTLFYGYGSYGGIGRTSINPNFLTWVTEGGILVFAHVRGDGHKGDAWHKAGYKITKPNTWKDMIATTEHMIREGYTSSDKAAIWGSSAGGILAGRAMTERPDLYKAVILTSPATNMLRSEVQPNGKNSIKEFGTVEIKEEFEALLEMDSYHHIKKGVKYPATLVTGGMKDGRVVIWDPAKFVARLQVSNAANTPILFNVNFEHGHAGINTSKQDLYESYANAFSFALWQMGHPDYQPN
ncbi:prolyl oligopeptidase family serine peptidase [Aquimarina spongiae]|uniref:prolyl oligopeptidase n=1 Tax=Aquimarina spongiae TaxID=570521 RepID=A0A1M6JLK1_9FLAO|nr:prolyl oligopeptidase family serine peptidase [Aquimarina spongiae]SHJ47589.1 oligopeptidase B Serine peptidase. MEROPS family S09A [Aquimarina spongiae]